jgi:hypothetical protein
MSAVDDLSKKNLVACTLSVSIRMFQQREQYDSWTVSLASSVSVIVHEQTNTVKPVLNESCKKRNPVFSRILSQYRGSLI